MVALRTRDRSLIRSSRLSAPRASSSTSSSEARTPIAIQSCAKCAKTFTANRPRTHRRQQVDIGSAAHLAEALDVGLASELADFAVVGQPLSDRSWAEVPGLVRALQRAGIDQSPTARVLTYQRVVVLGADGIEVEVGWRATGETVHVRAGEAAALGRALAWRTNHWHARAAMAEVLLAGTDEGAGALLDAEDAL